MFQDRFGIVMDEDGGNDELKFDFRAKADFLRPCEPPAENTKRGHVSETKVQAEQNLSQALGTDPL